MHRDRWYRESYASDPGLDTVHSMDIAAACASKLCHICGNTFAKAFLPVHQRQCIKRYTNNSSRAGLNSVEFLGFQEQFAGSQPCTNCMQTVPRNRLSAHLRVCKGSNQPLEKSNVRDRERAEYAVDINKPSMDLQGSEFKYAPSLSLVPPIPRGNLKSDSIEPVAVAADGPIKRQSVPKQPLARQSPNPDSSMKYKRNPRESLIYERDQGESHTLAYERLSFADRGKISTNIEGLPVRLKPKFDQDERDATVSDDTSQDLPSAPDDEEQNNYAGDVVRIPCQLCGRKFAEDRLSVHIKACKVASKTRKVFDAGKARVRGTDLEKYTEIRKQKNPAAETIKLKVTIYQAVSYTKLTTSEQKSNWRAKHQNFIQMVRAARDPNAKDSNSDNLNNHGGFDPYADYVQCEHCGRRFNEDSAKRHIPVCASAKAKQRFTSPQKTSIMGSQSSVSPREQPARKDEMLKKRIGFKPPKPKSKSTLSLK
ncbi:hypothetical protein BJ742DRAFT_227861 [Cladochytrium replicatum]|nr:hypothetical protein BJ742DRAFT_227861 [Cladochytrium replicatum]